MTTVVAISTGHAILAWVGLVLGLVVAVLVVVLFSRVVRPLREVRRYSGQILPAGIAIAKNLDDVDELMRTRELARAVPGLAGGYLQRLGSGSP